MTKEQIIDLSPPQNKILQKILRQQIPNKTVWAFGSRVEWRASETSDLDLVAHKCSGAEIADLKEALEESALHCSVDVLNWEDIPDSFRANIKKHYVVVQQNTVPEGWRVVRLGEIGKILMCKRVFKKETLKTGIPFYKIKTFGKEPDSFISKELYNLYRSKYSFPKKGEVLLSTSGTIGRTIVYDGKPAYFQDSNIVWIDNNEAKVLNSFLYYFYRINSWSTDGTTIPRLYSSNLSQVKITLPPLPEQKAIAEVLSSLDDKIDLLRKQNKTLEGVAQTLFHKWFMEDAGDDWEIGILGDIVEIETGKKVGKGQPHYLEIGDIDISTRGYDIEGKEKCTVSGAVTVPKNTLLVSKVRPTRGAITITKSEVNVSGAFTRIKFTNKYIYPCVNRASFFGYLGKVSTGSTYPTCKDSDILNYEIAIPPQKLLNAFNETVTPCFDKIQYNRLQVQHLKNLRDVLLPKLMSGKIRVKQ